MADKLKNYELFLKNEQKVHIDALSILGGASCLKKVDGKDCNLNEIIEALKEYLINAEKFEVWEFDEEKTGEPSTPGNQPPFDLSAFGLKDFRDSPPAKSRLRIRRPLSRRCAQNVR